MEREIGKKLCADDMLLPGDLVVVVTNSETFSDYAGQSGKCISSCNSSPKSPVLIEFDDGELVEGNREDLIITEFYTGATPE